MFTDGVFTVTHITHEREKQQKRYIDREREKREEDISKKMNEMKRERRGEKK